MIIILHIPWGLRIILSCLCILITLVIRLFHLESHLSTSFLMELLWVKDSVSVLLMLWSYFCLCHLTFFFRPGLVMKKVIVVVLLVMLFFMGFCIIMYSWQLVVIRRSILLIFQVHSVGLFVERHQLWHFSWQLIENTLILWVNLFDCWEWSWSFDFWWLRYVVWVGCFLLLKF